MIVLEIRKQNNETGGYFYADTAPPKRARANGLRRFLAHYNTPGRIVAEWTIGEPPINQQRTNEHNT